MVKYLQMDGLNDYIQCPSVTITSFELDMNYQSKGTTEYIFDGRTGLTDAIIYNGTYKSGLGKFTGTEGTTYLNGSVISNSSSITKDVRILLKAVSNVVFTDNVTFFAKNDVTNFGKGLIYAIKIYNGTTLVAHYDMSTGTVNDISGNGNHATLTGGTWLDDGTGGGDTGTDGTTAFDLRQSMYQDSAFSTDTRFSLYVDGSTQADTKKVLYEISSTSFDMLQEIFSDGQVGQTPFDMRLLLYSDGSILHDSRQAMYESGQNAHDLQQAIYESGESKADMHLVLFADSSTHHDLIQALYQDAAIHFDTKQISFNPDQQKIGTIRLKGKRDLYVYLVGKQELYVPLKAKRELTVSLKGGVNMTMQNQNFSMSAGDTKYLTFSIEGADDLTGATITWGARQRSYSNVDNLITKSTGDGITVEGSEVKIKLDPEDTEMLSGTYHHECQLEDNLQNVSTVFTGLMTVNKSAV